MSTAFTIVCAGNELEKEMRERTMRERVGRVSEGFAIVDDDQLLNRSSSVDDDDDVCMCMYNKLLDLAGMGTWRCVTGWRGSVLTKLGICHNRLIANLLIS